MVLQAERDTLGYPEFVQNFGERTDFVEFEAR